MSLRLCLGCGKLIRSGSRCSECTPRNGSTRAWRATRAQILATGPRCACGQPATEVDHIVPVARGGTDALSNLRPICGPCNRRKGAS